MQIALIAENDKHVLMENICIAYRHILIKHTLIATGKTGTLIEQNANLPVKKYLSGSLGGLQQLGSHLSHNDIDLVILLRDFNKQSIYSSNEFSIINLCEINNIPLAMNLSTAEIVLLALERGDLDWRNII